MKYKIALPILLALSFAGPAPAAGGTPINESRPFDASGKLSVENISGKIEVVAWGKNEVQVTGTLGAGSERLELSGGPSDLRVKVVLPSRARDVEASELYLRVPEGARVELQGVSADLIVRGTRGAARLTTVSGEVTVEGAMAELRVESVSGDLSVKAPSTHTRLEAVSGDIKAQGLAGELHIETVSGDARVSGGAFRRIEAESVSGDFEFRIDSLADGGQIDAGSVSGDFDFVVAKPLNAKVELETFSGDLDCNLGAPSRKTRESWAATLGNGSGRVEIESHSGDIRLRR